MQRQMWRPTHRPDVVVFDVNETLSDLAPLDQRFAAVGAPPGTRRLWFASVLRDGIALAAAGATAPFAEVAAETLRGLLRAETGAETGAGTGDVEAAVEHVMSGFAALGVHPDVVPGVKGLAALGLRLVTLSNGAASVAEGLLDRAGLRPRFERLLSVEDAGVWKPAPGAYHFGLTACGVTASEAMLVAVHPWDVDGAGRAGMATAWLNRSGAPYPAFFRPPDVEVTSLPELADLLG